MFSFLGTDFTDFISLCFRSLRLMRWHGIKTVFRVIQMGVSLDKQRTGSVQSVQSVSPKNWIQKNGENACRFKKKSYLCIAFEKEHFWKEVLERWQSGRSRRSWKPLYWEVPGVRIPLSPQEIETSKRLKFIWRILFVSFLLQGGSRQRGDGLVNPSLSARKWMC